MTAARVIVRGRVQGVGYRAWVAREARTRGLKGWVRNRSDGAVEAVFMEEEAIVNEMIAACHKGPRLAVVSEVEVTPDPGGTWAGFDVRDTV